MHPTDRPAGRDLIAAHNAPRLTLPPVRSLYERNGPARSRSRQEHRMATRKVSLSDKYDLSADRVFVSGTQAVVRLMLMQKERDRRAGLNTGGYVTGYRGSPLGGLDQQFWRSRDLLSKQDLVFQAGLNEDLAATALWGTQQAEMRGEGRFDGVFGIWYGKGPGVDRSGDVLRHSNLAGTSPNGGVIALMGDDHTAESSTTAHQSEFAFMDAMIPIFNPAGVQEVLDYGLSGWALSRFAGTWAGLKCVKDNIESTASIDGSVDRVSLVRPQDFDMPPGGLNIRPADPILDQEARLHDYKLPAVMAFLRANGFDRLVHSGGRAPKVGIVSTGKSWLDVHEAIDALGIDEVRAADLGLRLYKVAVPWPLEPDGIRRFADGLDLIIVVEEKRGIIEPQIKNILYGTANAPAIVGKYDEKGQVLFPSKAALDLNEIAIAIGERLIKFAPNNDLGDKLGVIRDAQEVLRSTENVAVRIPYFCAGCPHNSSTVVPEGSHAYAGIGCHYMAQWMDRSTEGYTQMGGEGANWIGESHFSKRDHVFQNLGDGTYNHSGVLAIRAAKASGANITYKILYNDAVAMTGGQPHEGSLGVDEIARQVAAEGARRVTVVTDEPDKYDATYSWPANTAIHHRSELIEVQKDLRQVPGLSVLIYDQTCAAEKRRRRKRGLFPDPDKRVVINEQVCEGCGDCGVQSNCVAIQPVETEFGRKRQIDQSTCNKDFSCINGFCPSFVTVHGGKLKKATPAEGRADDALTVPEPAIPELTTSKSILITGVGGTGVVTVGAVLGMAAHLEGKGCGIIDMAGLAQKGGSVMSHMRIAPKPEDISAIRVAAGTADLVLGCDMVVVGSGKVLSAINPGVTDVVVNTHEQLPGDFTRNTDFSLPGRRLIKAIGERAGEGRAVFVDATRIATALLGDSIAANMFMLGYAWQRGAVPIARASLHEALSLNGVAVTMNTRAFELGRLYCHDPNAVSLAAPQTADPDIGYRRKSDSLDEIIARRRAMLTGYQDVAYGDRFARRVGQIRDLEAKIMPGQNTLSETVARTLYKLMAIKDEYEVARLYTNGDFLKQIASQFESWDRLEFHLAPPLLSKRNPETGKLQKQSFGPWMMKAFGLLARLRRLRGSPFDVFGYTEERRMERRLLAEYETALDDIVGKLSAARYDRAVAYAAYPETIRGYGHVKEANVRRAEQNRSGLRAAFLDLPVESPAAAAE
ncbi:MAG: indolepyruvate ferredoxin oxidoreductase family protein [Pseudomonadota bacterium]